MKKVFSYIGIAAGLTLLLFVGAWFWQQKAAGIVSPLTAPFKKATPTPASKYAPFTFEALAKTEFKSGKIVLGAATRQENNYTTYVFTYKSDGKTVSGMANMPVGQGPFPVVVLLRGWADRQNYHIGLGTERSANNLAEHGFLTLAPDFLGYGYSDWEDEDILLARFYRPVEILNLLASIPSLPQADTQKIGLWGHSNGGQIVLSLLEITGKVYPTSLWAPVSLAFPESVLVYLGTEEEVGSLVEEKIAEFSRENDPKKYSIVEYFDQIKAPLVVHQGTADQLIEISWTKELVSQLKAKGLEVGLYLYSGENHNLNFYKNTGETARKRDLDFFSHQLKN
ncbi:MAG TPA: alpha/beta fold hydrolase [Clostridia bacterium]|nr:alpha/beta fold hydrolase [Clostridia bacterium]